MPSTRKNPGIDEALIQQFMTITGADEATALRFLESCAGNVNAAVEMYMDLANGNAGSGTNGTTAKRKREESPSNSNENASSADSDPVRAPIPQKTEVLAQNRVSYLTQQDVDQTRGPGGGPRPRELFPPPSGLMFQGSFAQARQAAAQSNRWLVTTINKVTEFQCQVVNRDVWSSARVQELIRQQFILWQGYSDTEDGKRYMVLYGINDWPHIAIIDPRTGEKMVSWQKVDVDSFHETASDFLTHYPAPSVSDLDLRPTKKAKTESSTGDATSDASHQVPATSRPGPSRSGRGPQTDDVGTDVDGADSDSDSNDAPEDGQQDESWKEHKGDDSDPMTTIVFRGPFNSRHQLTLPNSSTLMALVSFMTGLGYAANRYELLALFPNRVISQLDLGLTLAEAGLGARETLQIHRKRR